jgi:hypothetical protein
MSPIPNHASSLRACGSSNNSSGPTRRTPLLRDRRLDLTVAALIVLDRTGVS